jgi:hypothetical protein
MPSPASAARRCIRTPVSTALLLFIGCRDPADVVGKPDEGASRLSLQPGHASIRSIPVRELCVTRGRLGAQPEHRAINRSPSLLATAPSSGGKHAAIRFQYLGKVGNDGRSESDVERQQLGLQLLHRNACNTVHVSWRLSERSFVTASIQSTPAVTTQEAECDNHRELRPFWREPVDAPEAGTTRQFAATIRRGLLEVRVDHRPVLRAVVAGHGRPESGFSGLRSHNVQFELLHFQADHLQTSIAPIDGCARRG